MSEKKIIEAWEQRKHLVQEKLITKHPEDYKELVTWIIEMINPHEEDELPDPEKIHEIDDGHYQGTLLYVIPEKTYQPNKYWYVLVNYGSCSGCDTLEGIRAYDDELPTNEQIKEYMTLALHIVQKMKTIGGYDEMFNEENEE